MIFVSVSLIAKQCFSFWFGHVCVRRLSDAKKNHIPKIIEKQLFHVCMLQDVFKFKVWVIFFSNQSKYFSNVKVVFSYDMYHDAFSGISHDIE